MQKSNQDVPHPSPSRLRCAIYTRKSTEEGLEQEFNSLDAQREAAEAFIQSQRREGWIALPELYDDGGFTGANMDRPDLARLLHAVEAGELDCVVVYKVDRLSRSLLDFTRMLSVFEKHKVSFVAVKSLGMGLDEKAIEAVEKWKFRPGMKSGQPVNVRAMIEVNFRFQ